MAYFYGDPDKIDYDAINQSAVSINWSFKPKVFCNKH